jgi:hypothetical protein
MCRAGIGNRKVVCYDEPQSLRAAENPLSCQVIVCAWREGLADPWAASSVGRAPRSQRGGRGFESPAVHQIPNKNDGFGERAGRRPSRVDFGTTFLVDPGSCHNMAATSPGPGPRSSGLLFFGIESAARRDRHVETEYRHNGTTIDIYVKQRGFLGDSSEVFVELKRNLLHKAQLDRLVGQVESLQPSKNAILVILCGQTNPALVTRLNERYQRGDILDGLLLLTTEPMLVIVKEGQIRTVHSSVVALFP